MLRRSPRLAASARYESDRMVDVPVADNRIVMNQADFIIMCKCAEIIALLLNKKGFAFRLTRSKESWRRAKITEYIDILTQITDDISSTLPILQKLRDALSCARNWFVSNSCNYVREEYMLCSALMCVIKNMKVIP